MVRMPERAGDPFGPAIGRLLCGDADRRLTIASAQPGAGGANGCGTIDLPVPPATSAGSVPSGARIRRVPTASFSPVRAAAKGSCRPAPPSRSGRDRRRARTPSGSTSP